MKQVPQEKNILHFEQIAQNIYKVLDTLQRAGWVDHGVKNPESVKEHTIALLELAIEMEDELSEEEKFGLLEMLEVHDWPEALHGDEIILELKEGEQNQAKETKFKNEKRALQELCKDMPNREDIMDLWLRFESSDDPAASFGRELDKYQSVEKALEYEEEQGIALFEEFLKYSINFISHPVLLKRIEDLQSKHDSLRP